MDKRTFAALQFFGSLSTESIESLNREGGYSGLASKYAAQKAANDRLRVAALNAQPGQVASAFNARPRESAELLQACRGLLEVAETGVTSLGTLRLARAAIAKATGGVV